VIFQRALDAPGDVGPQRHMMPRHLKSDAPVPAAGNPA